MDPDFASLTVEQIATAMQEKKLSPTELGNTLARRAAEAQKKLNLFISIDPKYIAGEIKRVEKLMLGGDILKDKNNSLLGVPFALADNIVTGDLKTTCASRFMAAYQSPFDARVTLQLKENGAFLAGKTNLEEFGLGCSGGSSYFGTAKNPRDIGCCAGSGAAAAVSAGLVALALASDTRGELRQASSYCGIMGLKPTYGRISRRGLIDSASSLEQIGILARQVSDLAAALQILAAPEPDNPITLQTEAPLYAGLLEKLKEKPKIAIAVPACWNEAPYLQENVKVDFEEQLAILEKLGLTINFVTLPYFKEASLVATIICAVEAFSNLSNMDGVRFGQREEGDHLQAMYIKTRTLGFSSKLKNFITFGGFISTPKYYETFFQQGQKMRTLITKELEGCLQKNDLLLTPTVPFYSPPLDSPLSGKEFPDPAAYYTAAANLGGFPALSFPLTKDSSEGSPSNTGEPGSLQDTLPGSLQFIAKKEDEVTLLQIASLLEKERPFCWSNYALALQEI